MDGRFQSFFNREAQALRAAQAARMNAIPADGLLGSQPLLPSIEMLQMERIRRAQARSDDRAAAVLAEDALARQVSSDPWAGSYVTNPDRLEQATIGGAAAVAGSGGPSTATPGLLAPAEQLAANLDLTGSPNLAAALASGVNLDANPKGDLRQFDATNRGAPIAIEEAAVSPADAAVQQARQGRRQGRRAQAAADVAAGAANAIGYIPADLGAGKWIASKSAQLSSKIPVTNAATHTAAQALGVGGKFLGAGVRALPWVAAAAPAVMGAIEGSQSGSGGAAIQGGTATAGTLIGGAIGSFVGGPGLGTVIGAGIGGMLGNAAGDMGRSAAVSAVEAAQGGDTGLAGQIGRSLDGVIDTPMEVESRQMVAQMNSPAVLALKAEERQRNAAERARMAQDLLMQAYARGIG